MLFNIEDVDRFFPMEKYRPGQKASIIKILEAFNSGAKQVLFEAPVGSGKSAIGFTIAQMVDNTFYLTNQRFLQDQVISDFGDKGKYYKSSCSPMIDLKGRNNYPCNIWSRALADPEYKFKDDKQRDHFLSLSMQKIGCDRGQCKRQGRSKLPYCVDDKIDLNECPYFIRLRQAQAAKICLMNYHSFLFQTSVAMSFGRRSLLILDEAHSTEDILLKFVELSISDRHFQTMGIRFPQLETVSEYLEYLKSIKLDELIAAKIRASMLALNSKEEEDWKNQLLRYKILLEADPEQWVSIWEEVESGASRSITLKPIFVDKFAQEYIFNKAGLVLMMSATILSRDVMCGSLGIPRESSRFIRLGSSFPKNIRPCHYRPVGSMSFKNKADTIPKLVKAVNNICKFHASEHGIIHTHTFAICMELLQKCEPAVRSRFLFQKDFEDNKQKLLEAHKKSKNSIIIAPAMHEGLDLVSDLGRFAIICKCPYPSKADPQISIRMEADPDWYDWVTACKACQSYGRIYRHDKDFGVTYLLDSDFRPFISRVGKMLPDWFLEAIIWE